MPHLDSLPDQATLVDVYKLNPPLAAASLALNQAVMRGDGPFGEAQREAIAAYVSTINGCGYCLGVHSGAATGLGMDSEAVNAICLRPDAPDDPRLVPVLAYVGKLTKAPSSIERADIEAMYQAGWGDDAVSLAAQIAALYAFMNRLVEGHGVSGDPAVLQANGERLAKIGYDGLADLIGVRGG